MTVIEENHQIFLLTLPVIVVVVVVAFATVVVVVIVVDVIVLKPVVTTGTGVTIAAILAGSTGPWGLCGGSCERKPYSTY